MVCSSLVSLQRLNVRIWLNRKACHFSLLYAEEFVQHVHNGLWKSTNVGFPEEYLKKTKESLNC